MATTVVADGNRLREIKTFPSLVRYLRDELDWPIESDDFEEVVFDYEPEELGIDPENAAKIQEIKQLRPLADGQAWGIFFIKFEPRKLPVVALRRILRASCYPKAKFGEKGSTKVLGASRPAVHLALRGLGASGNRVRALCRGARSWRSADTPGSRLGRPEYATSSGSRRPRVEGKAHVARRGRCGKVAPAVVIGVRTATWRGHSNIEGDGRAPSRAGPKDSEACQRDPQDRVGSRSPETASRVFQRSADPRSERRRLR